MAKDKTVYIAIARTASSKETPVLGSLKLNKQ